LPENNPKLYTDLAEWFYLLTAPEEYAEEAEIFRRTLLAANPRIRTLLELGSGGGSNASHLKRHFAMTLVELSEAMIAQSQRTNPELPHLQGDMRTVRLGHTFDAVFIHDAIVYMTTEEDLRQAILTAAAHLGPGGVALLVPDHVRETYRPGTDHGGHDGVGESAGRALRYLEWSYDPDPTDTQYTVDYAYLLREKDGTTRIVHDRHIEGLFPRATWLRLMDEAGFDARLLPFDHSEVEPGETEMILGVKR